MFTLHLVNDQRVYPYIKGYPSIYITHFYENFNYSSFDFLNCFNKVIEVLIIIQVVVYKFTYIYNNY